MKSLAILIAAALGGTASAQVPMGDDAFAARLQGIRSEAAAAGKALAAAAAQAVAAAPAAARHGSLLTRVMVAMYDAPGTGELLVGWLRDEKNGAAIFNDSIPGVSAGSYDDGVPVVSIRTSAAEPFSYRYLAALIARETAALMLADFPDSAEKSYIQASRMAETYFELGGTRLGMDDIDGHKDAAVSASIRLWVENDPTGGVSVLKRRGQKSLLDMPASGRIEAAKAAWEQFKKYEKDWLWNHQGSLQ
ncbi:MAG: hypothetical protein HY926_02985 [Elusimicrobia bacterium]|nr:hypothetical protein [Elusimicrobiota bacterium]